MEQEFHGLYIQPEAWHADIPNSAKILHGRLCNLPSFNDGGSHASRDWMAKEIGVSKQRITQLIKILIDNKLIIDNGWYTNSNGNKTRLLKRGILTPPNKKLLDPLNKKLLDPPNKKLLANYKSINNKSNILFTNKFVNDIPELLADWVDKDYGYKFDILYSFRNGDWPKDELKNTLTASLINPYQKIPDSLLAKYLRFALTTQEIIQRNAPAKSTHFSDKQLAQHILAAVTEIDKLCRLDHFDFEACIKPALRWAIKDPFWSDQILSLSNLRNKGKNGLSKFFNLYNAWCKAEQIDPKMGRLGKKSDFIDHGYYGE